MSPDLERYRSGAMQTLLAVRRALHERPLRGKTVDELARELEADASRDQVYRATANLALAGEAEQTGGRGSPWRLTPMAAQLSERYRLDIADLHRTYLGDPQ